MTMTKTVTSRYDVAEHLRTPEEMAAYLEASIEEADGDTAFIAKALGDIARAKGMSRVACDAGLSREIFYKALSGRAQSNSGHGSPGCRRSGSEATRGSAARFGRRWTGHIGTSPRPWSVIGEAVEKIRDETIARHAHDPDTAALSVHP